MTHSRLTARRLALTLFAALPTWATQMGFHGYDDRARR